MLLDQPPGSSQTCTALAIPAVNINADVTDTNDLSFIVCLSPFVPFPVRAAPLLRQRRWNVSVDLNSGNGPTTAMGVCPPYNRDLSLRAVASAIHSGLSV